MVADVLMPKDIRPSTTAMLNYEITEYDNGTWISFWTIHKQIIRRQATRRLLLLVGVVFWQWYHASTKAPLTVWSYYVTYIVVDALFVRMQLFVYFQRNRKQFGISLMYVKPPLHILFTAHTVMPVGCKRRTISMDLISTAIRGRGVISIKILPEILRSPLPNVDKFWNSAQINQVQVRTLADICFYVSTFNEKWAHVDNTDSALAWNVIFANSVSPIQCRQLNLKYENRCIWQSADTMSNDTFIKIPENTSVFINLFIPGVNYSNSD